MAPSSIRYAILVLATAVALLLYLDRYCLSTSDSRIQKDLDLTDLQMAWIHGSFFLTYALGQIPMGRLTDRFGVRHTLAAFMILWSAFTGLIGAVTGFVDFILYRFGCGLFEAGAYPACAGMIRHWFPDRARGIASGIVSLGGRFGGTVTPLIVPLLMDDFGWRGVLAGLGVFGILQGIFFFWFYRNRPREQPMCNEAEVALIESGQVEKGMSLPATSIPWGRILTHSSLWVSSFIQFGINFGWVFILTRLNRFLEVYYGVDADTRPWMVFAVMICNLPALLLGGRITDYLTVKHGKRLGRAIPLLLPRFLSAAAFLAIGMLLTFAPESALAKNPWTVVILLGVMSFFSDMTLPAIWGFNLDVGRRHVGLVLGWGNMWGNLGGFASPLAVVWVVANFGWPAVFWMFGACFVIIGVAALLLNADDPLERDTPLAA